MIKLSVMILDLLVSALLSIITLTEENPLGKNESSSNETNSTATGQAIASVVIFALAGILYILIITYCCCNMSTIHNVFFRRRNWVALGGLCYYIGDNLPPLIEEYRDELNCNSDCFEVIQVIGAFMLGVAAITYLPLLIIVVPKHYEEVRTNVSTCTNRVPTEEHNQENEMTNISTRTNRVPTEEHNQENERTPLINNPEGEHRHINKELIKALVYAGLIMLAKTTNFDLVYTAIERAVSINCNTHMWIGAWVYWVFYFVFFSLVSLYQVRIYEKAEIRRSASAPSENTTNADKTSAGNTSYKQCIKTSCTSGNLYATLLSVFAGLYILADTRLPLACTGVAEDDTRTRHVIRISLWVITLFVAAWVIIIWTCWQNKHHKRYALY